MPPGSSSGQQQPGSRAGARWGGRGDLLTRSPLPPRDAIAPALHRLSPPRARQAPTPSPGQVGGSSRQSFRCKAGPSGPGPRNRRLCWPGGTATSLLPLLQGGTAAVRPFLFPFPVAPTEHVNARAPRGPRGPGPTLTLAAAMPRPGCGQLRAAGRSHWLAGAADLGGSLPVPTAARAAIQPGSVRARPASPRPPAGAGHAGAASPLAGPGRGCRGARDPDGLCPAAGRARVWGRRTGPAHVTPAALSSRATSAAGGRQAVAGFTTDFCEQVASRGKLLASAAPRGCSRASRPTGGACSWGS